MNPIELKEIKDSDFDSEVVASVEIVKGSIGSASVGAGGGFSIGSITLPEKSMCIVVASVSATAKDVTGIVSLQIELGDTESTAPDSISKSSTTVTCICEGGTTLEVSGSVGSAALVKVTQLKALCIINKREE